MLTEIFTMHSTEIGLVLFFLSFVFILGYSLTRSRQEVDDWSNLPLVAVEPGQAIDKEKRA